MVGCDVFLVPYVSICNTINTSPSVMEHGLLYLFVGASNHHDVHDVSWVLTCLDRTTIIVYSATCDYNSLSSKVRSPGLPRVTIKTSFPYKAGGSVFDSPMCSGQFHLLASRSERKGAQLPGVFIDRILDHGKYPATNAGGPVGPFKALHNSPLKQVKHEGTGDPHSDCSSFTFTGEPSLGHAANGAVWKKRASDPVPDRHPQVPLLARPQTLLTLYICILHNDEMTM